jgi:hypothetical protein
MVLPSIVSWEYCRGWPHDKATRPEIEHAAITRTMLCQYGLCSYVMNTRCPPFSWQCDFFGEVGSAPRWGMQLRPPKRWPANDTLPTTENANLEVGILQSSSTSKLVSVKAVERLSRACRVTGLQQGPTARRDAGRRSGMDRKPWRL